MQFCFSSSNLFFHPLAALGTLTRHLCNQNLTAACDLPLDICEVQKVDKGTRLPSMASQIQFLKCPAARMKDLGYGALEMVEPHL